MRIIKELPHNPNWTERKVTKHIILHHADISVCSIQDIDAWHYDNGWNGGCGYHFLVRKNTKIYEGRPINIIGAHCEGWNSTSIGICFEGNFNQEKMSVEQEQAGIDLIRWIRKQYSGLSILRHKDALPGYTCPGANFRNYIIFEGSKDDMTEVKTVEEALKVMLEEKVINTPEQWRKAADVVKFQDQLYINTANALLKKR